MYKISSSYLNVYFSTPWLRSVTQYCVQPHIPKHDFLRKLRKTSSFDISNLITYPYTHSNLTLTKIIISNRLLKHFFQWKTTFSTFIGVSRAFWLEVRRSIFGHTGLIRQLLTLLLLILTRMLTLTLIQSINLTPFWQHFT